jgi:predicted Zn-dependent peptidase
MSARLHRLPNGFTVAVEPMAGVETLAVGLYAAIGSRSEPVGAPGLAHMVEHMVFKGAGTRDAKRIAEDIEDVGGSLNAWTARDHTVFHARLLAADLALGVDMIADLVRDPHLDADELEREKGVVLAELGEANDTPDDVIFDHLQGIAFPGQPLGAPVLGTEASIAAIDVAAMRDWIGAGYRAPGLVLAAAGNVDEDALLALAEARFGDLPSEAVAQPASANFAPGVHHDVRRFDQLHLALAYPGLPHEHADAQALGLFASAAGGGMSSRLFQEVREARGLAYSVYAWNQGYADAGLFGVYLAAARRDGPAALKLVRAVLAASAETLDAAELHRAKRQAKAGILMGLESVQSRCDHLGRSLQVHGRIVSAAETVERIDAVDVAQARRVGAAALAGGEAFASVGGKLAKAA